jgi:predicted DNA-binding antitoxin AbrB/MazE fold protein
VVNDVLSKAIRAKYEKGVLKPLEPLELSEGEEVIVRVEGKPAYGLAELVEGLRKETPKVDKPLRALEDVRQ